MKVAALNSRVIFRFLALPLAALAVGLIANSFHPRGVSWQAQAPVAEKAGNSTPKPPLSETNTTGSDADWPQPIALKELRAVTRQFVIVDARTEAAYKASHIPGAISLPYYEDAEAPVAAFKQKHSLELLVVTYCDTDFCTQAMDLAYLLLQQGYNVRILEGGFEHWCDEGSPPLAAEKH